jgi:MoaA/NifB/PqqE/SkfB family radical SAM enzyme
MNNSSNLIAKEKTTQENRVWVRIASACNNKCLFCLDADAQNWTLPKEEYIKEQIKAGYKEWQYNRIIISGWEASINPKFPDYIRYAKEIGYDRIQTVTNGNMFFHEAFCQKVFAAWLQEVTFSFHGHNSTLHDYLVATPWAFKKSLKWLIFVKKYFPEIITNIDIVVNKVNVQFLSEIVKFFMKLWIHEYDILQIIPFWRGFSEYKNTLFYDIKENLSFLHDTWRLAHLPWMYIWTNRFPAEAFEWFEDLIQDPRKIKSETMGESYGMFDNFIRSHGEKKPNCYGEACDVCFQRQYCHDYMWDMYVQKIDTKNYKIISWEEFPSQVYEKYGETSQDFINTLWSFWLPLINIPKCLGWTGIYQTYTDIKEQESLEDYTYKYIKHLYRKKSLRCAGCKYDKECKWLHLNFIRSYGFSLLQPIIWKS